DKIKMQRLKLTHCATVLKTISTLLASRKRRRPNTNLLAASKVTRKWALEEESGGVNAG
ncbi:unnamed protein product, partial [Ceratitis capitata]